jgi:hypothetical protein
LCDRSGFHFISCAFPRVSAAQDSAARSAH